MSRKIKIRYVSRHKETGKISTYVQSLDDIENNDSWQGPTPWEIVSRDEWTGLHDQNGVEIYEGDIVKWSWLPIGKTEPIEHIYSVVFSEGQFQQFEEGDPISSVWKPWGEVEVIGDIYENPELIAKEG